ncbi:MAG: putative DNA binding domain-containing protein, partial [Chloroflexi bacterium]|nr:putative DNA binding domain-containing protein [Chloroflexota bacterium]
MIFENKSVDQISDQEILELIKASTAEHLNLDYKQTIELHTDAQKFEAMLDIASFANADGGYLVVGMSDDDTGHPLKFEP